MTSDSKATTRVPYVAMRLEWEPWVPLHGAWLKDKLPSRPGLYRNRRLGLDCLDYIGQTGTTLKIRAGMLRGVYGDEMPWRS